MTEATDEVIDDVTDVTEYNDTTDEGIEVSNDNAKLLAKYKIDPTTFTEDDLIATLKRIDKAESRIVAEKKNPKSEPTTKYLTEADLERRDFLKANPELSEYTKELEQYNKKGLSLDEAKVLILSSDKARVNREKVNSLGLSDWETSKEKSTITKAELAKIAEKDPKEYNRLRDLMESGKISMR